MYIIIILNKFLCSSLDIICNGLDNRVENGWVSFVGGSQGLVANYGCELGYIPNDTSTTRHCECGDWTGHDIHCEGRRTIQAVNLMEKQHLNSTCNNCESVTQ